MRQAHALSNRVARNGRRSGQAYARMRRLMHSSFYEPSDAELDAWYEVAFAWRLRHRRVQPRSRRPALTFNGSIEGAPVYWSAATHEQLRAQCQSSMLRANAGPVDDIQIFGAAHHNGPSFWDAQATCVLVASNARLQRPVRGMVAIDGDIEGTPFHFEGLIADVQRAALTLIPLLTARANVDDVTINGRRYHNGPAFWNGSQVAQMVAQRALAMSQGIPEARPPSSDPRRERGRVGRRSRGAQAAPGHWSAMGTLGWR